MKSRDRNRISALVRKVFKKRLAVFERSPRRVTVGWPAYDEREIMSALDSLLQVRISQGEKVAAFERAFARYLGVSHAVAVNSGTSANMLALATFMEAGQVKRGDEVIVPAATFSSVVSPILQLGLVPVYVDVDPISWNIDPIQVARAITRRTRVLMPVHSFGNPADMKRLMPIARRHHLLVLEDCCEAHGARIGQKKVGSFGDLATLSFFVAHNITTGEGGMVFAKKKSYRDILVSLREFGRLPPEYVRSHRFVEYDKRLGYYDVRNLYVRLGYNVRMTDIAAALGIEQLKKLDTLNRVRLGIVRRYLTAFDAYKKYLQLPEVRRNTFHSFYGFPIAIRRDAPFSRRTLVQHLEKNGIETRSFFGGSLPDQPAFRGTGRVVGRLPVSRWLRDNAFFIGCHPALTPAHVRHVLATFGSFFSRRRASRL